MLDDAVNTVKELFVVYARLVKLADMIVLDGDFEPEHVIEYETLRKRLDTLKDEAKNKNA